MGGRGARSSGGGRGGGGGLSPNDIVSTTSLVSAREGKQLEVDETLQTFQDVYDEYGYVIDDIQIATLKGSGASTIAYYDGANIAMNQSYFDKARKKCLGLGKICFEYDPKTGVVLDPKTHLPIRIE